MLATKKLYVVTALFNPIRYKSRYRLYHDFVKRVEDAGAVIYTVEAALHDREFVVTRANNPQHIQVNTSHELWIKENLLNVGISKLPMAAEYVAVVDADLHFCRPDWVDETIHQLQHYRAVQMFSDLQYLAADHICHMQAPGFAFMYLNNKNFFKFQHPATRRFKKKAVTPLGYYGTNINAAPGGAWAYRRDALSRCGLLLDTGILGSGDYYMAHSIVGRSCQTVEHRNFHPEYKQAVYGWADRAERWFRRDIGYVSGTAIHYWHGKMSQRGYGHRDEILVRHQFNPRTDLTKDWQGVWQLEDDGTARFCDLRDAIRDYFRLRNEDSIDLE